VEVASAISASSILGDGKHDTITLDGNGVEDAAFYLPTISEEPGNLVAEGSISASEDLLRKLKRPNKRHWRLRTGIRLLSSAGWRKRSTLGQGVAGTKLTEPDFDRSGCVSWGLERKDAHS
jgi:hypothetical protein